MTRRSRRTSTLLPVVAAVTLVLAACGGASSGDGAAVDVRTTGPTASGLHGTALDRGYPLPTQAFTDTAGRRYVPATDAAKPVTLVFFGYTHCPDVCNVVLANVASALRRADPAAQQRTQLLFVTTDPARDTTPVVREYLDRFDSDFVGLRASVPTTEAAAATLHIAYEGTSADASGDYTVEHGTQVTGFAHGRAAVVWDAETPVADLRDDLQRLAGA